MLLSLTALIISILLIYLGSKKIVYSAARIADCINLQKVVVGTVLVASVTSAPELLGSVIAAFLGSSHMALGNIIGSNIYNIPLIVGVCGLIGEFRIKNCTIGKQCFFMIGLATLMMVFTVMTGMVTWWMGVIFLVFYPAFIYYSIRNGNGEGCSASNHAESKTKLAVFMLIGGGALICGNFLLVYSVTVLADAFGLSHFYAGLTIMALGCVFPETAVSIAAALHGEHEISIGNVIGDNIITITLVFGIVSILKSFNVSLSEILTTVPFMILITFILYAMNRRSHKITKKWSLLMLTLAFAALVFETFYFFA